MPPASSRSIFIVQGGPSAHHHFVGFIGDSRVSVWAHGETTPNRSRNAPRQTANFPQDPPQDAGFLRQPATNRPDQEVAVSTTTTVTPRRSRIETLPVGETC